MSLTFGF